MKEILLTAKIKVRNPVDDSQITPNIFTGKRIDEIEELELSVGNKKKKLKEFLKLVKSAKPLKIKLLLSAEMHRAQLIRFIIS